MVQHRAYAPQTIEFKAGAAITAGQAVMISGITQVDNPVPGLELQTPCPQVSPCAASEPTLFVGVAMEAASSGDWVKVCVEGVCDAEINSGENLDRGDPLTMAAAAGELAECGSSATVTEGANQIVAFAAEDSSGALSADTNLKVYIPPRWVDDASHT
jgi:predicted RecA/RadA family phage recombinase